MYTPDLFDAHVAMHRSVSSVREEAELAMAGALYAQYASRFAPWLDLGALSSRALDDCYPWAVNFVMDELRARQLALQGFRDCFLVQPGGVVLDFPAAMLHELVGLDLFLEAVAAEVWNREVQESYFEEYDSWASENPDALPSDYPVILAGGGEVWQGRAVVPELAVEAAPAVVVEAAPAIVLYSRVGADVQRLPSLVARIAEVCDGPFGAALREVRGP